MGIFVEDDNRSEAYIESVHTSPAVSERPLEQQEAAAVPLNQVNLALAPGASAGAGAEGAAAPAEEAAASTSAAGGAAAPPEDDLERARRFRQQQNNDDAGEQTFTCPVPGCGKSFDKQYLLKRTSSLSFMPISLYLSMLRLIHP